MPTFTNAGGLLLVLLVAALFGLAVLLDRMDRHHCDHCGANVGRHPRFSLLAYTPLRRVPVCRDCFTEVLR